MATSSPVELLRKMCGDSNQADVARDLGVVQSQVCDVLKGRRDPGPKLLRALGFERRVIYRRIAGRAKA